MPMKIRKSKCDQCLFSKNRIVPEKRAEKIMKDCVKNQTHFMCHKDKEIVCQGSYKELGHYSQMIRISERLKAIEFV